MTHKRSYYVVNAITLYRLLAAPVLIYLIAVKNINLFKWLLPLSFATDLADGYLARKYNAISAAGALLDSIADDLTIFAGVLGALVFFPTLIRMHITILAITLALYLIELLISLLKYKGLSDFHTYIAKIAAVLQGSYMILLFLTGNTMPWLFYAAVYFTILDLVEEILLALLLPPGQHDVKGIYWLYRNRQRVKNF